MKLVSSICNKTIIEKDRFNAIYSNIISEFYSFLKNHISNNNLLDNQEIMAFLMHIHNANNIRNIFKFKSEHRFDFMKYYEEVSRAPASLLAKHLFSQP